MGRMKDVWSDAMQRIDDHRSGKLKDEPFPRSRALTEDPFEALERRRVGINRVTESHYSWIDAARRALKASGKRFITSDDVYQVCPPPAGTHPNAVGAVFGAPEWFESTEEYVRSKRPSAHGRMIRRWRVR